ncbi:MAG: cell division protein SepF, partial [Clostridia bacterium]|nr:cell division protein SepF [Clostridia bacterium]
MGKFTSKLLNTLGINTNEEDDFEEYEEVSAPQTFEEPASFKRGKVVNINATTQFRVVVIQPETFDEAKEIADHLKERKPVVINLELMDKDTARKIFDFLNGAIYALGGSVQRVANNIYLIAPYNVTIMGDFRDELKNKG